MIFNLFMWIARRVISGYYRNTFQAIRIQSWRIDSANGKAKATILQYVYADFYIQLFIKARREGEEYFIA